MRRSVQLAAIGLIAASGCYSGGYDADYRSSLQRYRQEGEFQQLRPTPHVLADQRLALRVPKVFTDEDAVGDKNWSKPPFLQDFPGFRVAVQRIKEVDGVQWPAVLSVGVLTDKESGLDELKKKILNQVQKEASFAKAAWAAVEGQSGVGGKASWSVLKLGGPQPFDRVNKGVDEKNNTEGETQIWVALDPDAKVAAGVAGASGVGSRGAAGRTGRACDPHRRVQGLGRAGPRGSPGSRGGCAGSRGGEVSLWRSAELGGSHCHIGWAAQEASGARISNGAQAPSDGLTT